MPTSDLSHRLAMLHVAANSVDPNLQDPTTEFGHLSLQQLEETKLGFGKTHTNLTYSEIWKNHQVYVAWFLIHYGNSTRSLHKKFAYFCKLKIERAELQQDHVPLTDGPPKSKEESYDPWNDSQHDDDGDEDCLSPRSIRNLKLRVKSLEENLNSVWAKLVNCSRLFVVPFQDLMQKSCLMDASESSGMSQLRLFHFHQHSL